MRPLLLLDCYIDGSAAPNFLPHFSNGMQVVCPPTQEIPLDGVERWGGLVITGSAGSVVAPVPWVERVGELIRRAVDHDVPILGVCFGHQALAWALLGPRAVRHAAVPQVGWTDIDLHAPVLGEPGPRVNTFKTHADEVAPVDGMTVLASSAGCEVEALRIDGVRAWGVQFHAEMGLEECRMMIELRAQRHRELDIDPDALMQHAKDSSDLAARLFGSFERLTRSGD